jgi:hypothetical protein
MKTRSELAVTLSEELFAHLSAEAKRLDVPLEWLVAAMVLDTVDNTGTLKPIAA